MKLQLKQIVAPDDTMLSLRTAVHARPRAQVLLVHGYSDHGGQYEHVMELFHGHGFTIAAGDLRGHGTSAGERGHIRRFSDYLYDVQTMIGQLRNHEDADLPLLLVGHSLGGLVTLRFAQTSPAHVDGIVLAAPFLDLRFQVPAWKRMLAPLASLVVPAFALPSGLPPAELSHDPDWIVQFEHDPLAFKRATARWFMETLSAQGAARAAAAELSLPSLTLLAGDDHIVCNETARELHAAFNAAPAEISVYEDFYHALLHETEHARVVDDIVAWAERHLPLRR